MIVVLNIDSLVLGRRPLVVNRPMILIRVSICLLGMVTILMVTMMVVNMVLVTMVLVTMVMVDVVMVGGAMINMMMEHLLRRAMISVVLVRWLERLLFITCLVTEGDVMRGFIV